MFVVFLLSMCVVWCQCEDQTEGLTISVPIADHCVGSCPALCDLQFLVASDKPSLPAGIMGGGEFVNQLNHFMVIQVFLAILSTSFC